MRKKYLDNIRTFVILLVVLYHVVYIFTSTVPGVIGPVAEAVWMDAVSYLCYPWFMLILFMISGMCSAYYLEQHTEKEYLRSRTRKLLVPSTIGVLTFGWVQGWISMSIGGAFESMGTIPAPLLYLIMCLSGTGVLWTIQVMWVFSLLLYIGRRCRKGRARKTKERDWNILMLILLGVPAWMAAQVLNTPVVAVYRFGIYGFGFFMGYFLFKRETVIDTCAGYAIPLLISAGILGICYTKSVWGMNMAVEPAVNSPLAMSYSWIMCLAIFGCFRRWFDHSCAAADDLAGKSFGVYVFHYLPLSGTAYFLVVRMGMRGGWLYPVTAAAAFGGSLLIYEVVRRIPLIRWCLLGMKGKK